MHEALGIFEMNQIIIRKLMMYVSRDLHYVKHSLFFLLAKEIHLQGLIQEEELNG